MLDVLIDRVPRRGPPTPKPSFRHTITKEEDVRLQSSYYAVLKTAYLAWLNDHDQRYSRTVNEFPGTLLFDLYDEAMVITQDSSPKDLPGITHATHRRPQRKPPHHITNSVTCGYSGEVWTGGTIPERPLTGEDRMFFEMIPDLPPRRQFSRSLRKKLITL